MSQEHALLDRRPCKDIRVVGSGETGILHANEVELGLAPKQTSHDVVVEIFVSGELDHRLRCGLVASRQQPGANASRVESGLVLGAHRGGIRLPLL